MDFNGLSKLSSNASSNGKFPSAETLRDNISNTEVTDEQARRDLAMKVGGAVAIKSSVRTQIESMLPASFSAYELNTRTVNENRAPGTMIKTVSLEQFKNGAMDALDAPALAYMESVKESNKGLTLWVPKSAANAELSQLEIIELAEVNASNLHRPLYKTLCDLDDRLRFLNLFTRTELSGNNPISDDLVSHQFAPSTLTRRLYGTVQQQKDEYKSLRAENPGVNIHAPALAHSVGGWAIHADSGLGLPTGNDATYDRSVEVEARKFDIIEYVPFSKVNELDSDADGSWIGDSCNGHAWVGQIPNLAA